MGWLMRVRCRKEQKLCSPARPENGYASTFHSDLYFPITAPVVSAITNVYSEYYMADILSNRLTIKLHKNYSTNKINEYVPNM